MALKLLNLDMMCKCTNAILALVVSTRLDTRIYTELALSMQVLVATPAGCSSVITRMD